MVDKGHGTPIVLIPGLQGRWEWMRPAVDALAKHHRVITFSLCDERTSPFPCDERKAFENYVEQVDLALERAHVGKAVIAGVSYGGLIATEYAARRPERVQGLVLANALHRTWQPNSQQQRFLKAPRMMSPLFVATAPRRMRPEMAATFPRFFARLSFSVTFGLNVMFALASPAKMARRIEWSSRHRFADTHRIGAPALIVTGEPDLDRVVPVDVTRRYLNELHSAKHVVLKHTGHNGLVTRPDAFADLLGRFVNDVRLSA
ncbi:MAG TPA: alpha/beta hydrolase [Vicinamibacterales bacterium]|nr:alpha/beta hydrolase [Vicinamibacterales bacterium]